MDERSTFPIVGIQNYLPLGQDPDNKLMRHYTEQYAHEKSDFQMHRSSLYQRAL